MIVTADDMICVQQGWDQIIRNEMNKNFPDGDGVLHFNDGFTGEKLNTLPILTKSYYDRFGFVYNTAYKSLFCDNEFQEVAKKLNKTIYINQVLFPSNYSKGRVYCSSSGRGWFPACPFLRIRSRHDGYIRRLYRAPARILRER